MQQPFGTNGNRKLAIICSKGSLDMAYPGLILANAARMTGVDVDLFFTFWGLDIITKKKCDRLNVATVGNPSMHPWFHIPTLVGALPGMSALASWMMRREIEKLDFPPVSEFLEMIHDAGARIFACKATVDMMKLKREDLVDQVDDIVGAMEFIDCTEGAQLLFI